MSSAIKNIRLRLGGSQQWWADYLSISLSLLKLAETGQRSLPATALLKLSAIELLPPPADSTKAGKKKTTSNKSSPFASQIRKLELQLHRMENLLETTQQRHLQAVAAAAVAAQLLQTAGTSEEKQKDRLLLEAMQLEAARNEERYGIVPQALLQWKINCTTYAIAAAKKIALDS